MIYALMCRYHTEILLTLKSSHRLVVELLILEKETPSQGLVLPCQAVRLNWRKLIIDCSFQI